MMFALLNGIVGLVVSLDEEDPRHRADAVSQENVASDGFGLKFGVRRRALNESASVATAEHHYRPVSRPVPWRTCAVCFEI